MARKIIALLFVAMMALTLGSAQAVQTHGMNTANVPVADRSAQALQKALQEACNQVLVKISGNTSVSTVPVVQNAQRKINNLVESYSYATQTDSPGDSQLMLHVVFEAGAIKRLLKNAGQAIWSSDRPLTLIWLSVPEGLQTTVLSSDDTNSLTTLIKQTAQQRGIPMILPTMDLQDQAEAALTSTQLPSNHQLTVSAQRYGVQSVLAGSIMSCGNGQFQGEWQLLLHGTPYEWQTSGANVVQAVTNGINQAADMMANQLATIDSTSLQSTLTMQIDGVASLNDYVHVVAVLRHLTVVSKVTVSDMQNDTLLLKVNVVGGADGLVNALKIVQHLTAHAAPANDNAQHTNLFYHWHSAQQHPNNSVPAQAVAQNFNQTTSNGNKNNGQATDIAH